MTTDANELAGASPPGPDGTGSNGTAEVLHEMQIDEDLRESYLSYAMSVIISRALPDVRDGLKPSQRRILLAMHDLNLHPRAKESKCAGVVGETMKRYHPHGDNSIYPTLVRMAQPFSSRYPQIGGQGNFGNIDGLPPAAMRYTEAKLSLVAEELLTDLEKDTVDTIPNYDETRQEAVVLPSRFPNLLCNGSTGIAVGMATSIPPHNVGEICDAIILLIDKPDASLAELLQRVPGPDFPTGGIICGRGGIVESYKTGRGRITVRSRTEFETTKSGMTDIIVTEIPFMQQKMRLVEQIASAVKDEKVKGVRDVEDYSNREGIRIVISVRKDADPNVVLNQLFQNTPLQDRFSVIMLALVNSRPQTLGLKQLLIEFINHRRVVIRRRTQFLLRRARNRAHNLEGLLIALSSIDEVIRRIRASPDVPVARQQLMDLEVSSELLRRALGDDGYTGFVAIMGARDSYHLTRIQADHILQMQLQRLTALEQDKLLREYGEIREEIREYERILSDEANILAIVRQDAEEIKRKFGDPRRTEIIDDGGDLGIEDLIADEANVVTISHAGYIKRMPLASYRTQSRGGKGVVAGQTKEGDFLEDIFVASTHDYILFFTNHGQCHWLKVYDLPALQRTAQGRAVVNLLNLRAEERITSHIPVRDFDERNLFMITARGVVKKTALLSYSRPKQGGIIGISLDEGDELIAVLLTKTGDEVILSTKDGLSIRFEEEQARPMGRATHGVKGIGLQEGDEVVGAVVVSPGGSLLTVCEKGYGKRTSFEEYRPQNRGGKGLIDIKTSERNGKVVAVAAVKDDDELILISIGGKVVRIPISGINVIGRNTQGVRLMSIAEDDRVVSVAKIASEDIEVEVPEGEAVPATNVAELDSGEASSATSADELAAHTDHAPDTDRELAGARSVVAPGTTAEDHGQDNADDNPIDESDRPA